MKIFKDKLNLQNELIKNKYVSFIPTMGGLHKGHISLIKKSQKFKLKTLVSIYVNPKQFNNKTDYNTYPRNTKRDFKILKNLKVDYIYKPPFRDIYGFRPKHKVFLDKLSKQLCGKFRKGHFEGVLNVVNRLLEIIKPKYIFMGKKDYQQIYLIKKHIYKRNIKSKIIECDTIREKNGIACSSRNLKLSIKEKKIASKIYLLIKKIKKKGGIKFNSLTKKNLKKEIINLGANKIDYVECYDVKKFKKKNLISTNSNLFIAYYINNIRLIDNI